MSERPQLTSIQYRLLSYINGYIDMNGWAPSYRDMCAGTGLGSTSSVSHQLNALEEKGYIRRGPDRSPRMIAVTDA